MHCPPITCPISVMPPAISRGILQQLLPVVGLWELPPHLSVCSRLWVFCFYTQTTIQLCKKKYFIMFFSNEFYNPVPLLSCSENCHRPDRGLSNDLMLFLVAESIDFWPLKSGGLIIIGLIIRGHYLQGVRGCICPCACVFFGNFSWIQFLFFVLSLSDF